MFGKPVHAHRSATMTTGIVVAGALAGVVAASAPALAAEAPTRAVTTTAVDPNDALLRADQMPVVNQEQHWRRVATRHARVSIAQPGPLTDLGFAHKARRDFAEPGAQATSVVLTFASSAKAAAAYAQVKAWRQHTRDNVPAAGRLLFTDSQNPVAVQRGRGSFFDFVYKNDRSTLEGTFEWVGVTRRGSAVSIVAWRVGGADATYDVDPTIASVKTANVKLGLLG